METHGYLYPPGTADIFTQREGRYWVIAYIPRRFFCNKVITQTRDEKCIVQTATCKLSYDVLLSSKNPL
jgi:hypothetical protein